MDQQALPKSQHRFSVVFLFHFLLFSYPLLSLLWRRSYPLFTAETVILFLLIATLCFLLAFILKHVRPTLVNVLSALFITIVFMLQFNLLLLGIILCISFGVAVGWGLRANFQLYALPVLITLIIGAYFDSYENDGRISTSAAPPYVNSALPPVVHILLDGFIGIEGLPPYPASRAFKSTVYSFFDEHDFQVFSRAYSRYAKTAYSLYSAMNFEHDGIGETRFEIAGSGDHIMETNAEFDLMEGLGYRLNVFQTEHFDLCQSNPGNLDRCWEYGQPNVRSITKVRGLYLRIQMLAKVLLRQSALLSGLAATSGWFSDFGVAVYDPRIFAAMKDDIVNRPGGEFFFAHVLIPHAPFIFLHDCSINYDAPIWARFSFGNGEPILRDDIYEVRTMGYFEQADCALTSLGLLFEEMKTAGVFERSIIVVHGDHGSQIGKYRPDYHNIELLTPADYRANYSTLFAVKFPGQGGKVDDRVLSLSLLLEEFSKFVQAFVTNRESPAIFMQTLPDEQEKTEPYVYLHGKNPLVRVDINIFED